MIGLRLLGVLWEVPVGTTLEGPKAYGRRESMASPTLLLGEGIPAADANPGKVSDAVECIRYAPRRVRLRGWAQDF